MDRGNRQVILCDEGLRGTDRSTRRSLDIAALAEIAHTAGLPILIDPTFLVVHTDPDRVERILALCRAALSLGLAGIFARLADAPTPELPGTVDAETLTHIAAALDKSDRTPAASPAPCGEPVAPRSVMGGDGSHNMHPAP
jgi:3-deoxy-D-arabino-heptulosonate 7-phosphate (DAHP) synthase